MARGLPAPPRSPTKRHSPKNTPRPSSGARSAPSVIMVPDPMPLPRPTTTNARSRPEKSCARGMAAMPILWTKKLGTEAYLRPQWSMIMPAG